MTYERKCEIIKYRSLETQTSKSNPKRKKEGKKKKSRLKNLIPWSSSQKEKSRGAVSVVELRRWNLSYFVGVGTVMQMYLTTNKPYDHCYLDSEIKKGFLY